MLPDGWTKVPLSRVAEVRTGIAVGKTDLQDPVELPYLRVANVQDGHLDLSEIKVIRIERAQVERYLLHVGDVLMTEGGDFDKLGRGDVWRGEISICLHQNHVFCVRPNPERLHSEFLTALSASEYGKTYFLACAKRSTNLASINSTQLKGFPVLLPSLAEQRRIADVLSRWDRTISVLEQMISLARTQQMALVYRMLVCAAEGEDRKPIRVPAVPRARVPVSEGGYPPSVQPGIPKLASKPEGWRRMRLSEDLYEVRRQAAIEQNHAYTLVTVKRSRGGVEKRGVLRGSEIRTPTQFVVEAGDFLISKRQIVHGACGIVPQDLDGAIVSNEYAVLRSKGTIDIRFLRYLSETKYFQQTCFHSSIGVHVEKMIFSTERWLNWEFNIPPIDVQKDIVAMLDAAREEVELLSRNASLLRKEKRALMQQLLTGKRRVNLDSAAVPELEPQP